MTTIHLTPVSGGHILTSTEAADVLRCEATDALMLSLLSAVDAYIEYATGRDWTADAIIEPMAKQAARVLITMWHEDPARMGSMGSLPAGLSACLTQLEAKALELGTAGVPAEALEIVASIPADGDVDIAITANLVIVFNNQMASGSTSAAVLKDSGGSAVASSNAYDVTSKILTVNPTASLSAGASYSLEITDAADIYGQTLTETITFTTA